MVLGRGSRKREVGHLDHLNTKVFLAIIPLIRPYNNITPYFCHGVRRLVIECLNNFLSDKVCFTIQINKGSC